MTSDLKCCICKDDMNKKVEVYRYVKGSTSKKRQKVKRTNMGKVIKGYDGNTEKYCIHCWTILKTFFQLYDISLDIIKYLAKKEDWKTYLLNKFHYKNSNR